MWQLPCGVGMALDDTVSQGGQWCACGPKLALETKYAKGTSKFCSERLSSPVKSQHKQQFPNESWWFDGIVKESKNDCETMFYGGNYREKSCRFVRNGDCMFGMIVELTYGKVWERAHGDLGSSLCVCDHPGSSAGPGRGRTSYVGTVFSHHRTTTG